MRVLVTGASGLVGTALKPLLKSSEHEVVRLVRRTADSGAQEAEWNPGEGRLDVAVLENVDAVIHLAGEGIADGRWTDAKKQRIRDSRVDGTALIAEKIAACENPPRVLVSASAIGFYGARGDETLTEDSEAGTGFLPDVCRAWEDATDAARDAGCRVVKVRIGVVLAAEGGALRKMLLPFKLGVGGKVGNGRQYMSWIALDDLAGVLAHCLTDETLSGPVNATAPNPVTNAEFTRVLGAVLSRPTLLPLPGFAARLAFGELAEDLLLASARVVPKKLESSDYAFRFLQLESALRHILDRPKSQSA